jgi:hypothetical protein
VEHYRSISGEHPDRDEHRAVMLRQGKSLLRVSIERWTCRLRRLPGAPGVGAGVGVGGA